MLTKQSLDFGSTRKLLKELKANKINVVRPFDMNRNTDHSFFLPELTRKLSKISKSPERLSPFLLWTIPKSKGGNIVLFRNPRGNPSITSPRTVLFHEAGHALDKNYNSLFSHIKAYIKNVKQQPKGPLGLRMDQARINTTINDELTANANALQRIPDKLKSAYMDKVIPSFKIVTDNAKEEYSKIKMASSSTKLLNSYKQSKNHIELLSKLINESGNLTNSQTPNYFSPKNLERLKRMAKYTQQMEGFKDELAKRAIFPKVNNRIIDEFPRN
jgi:hypothetical protein